MVGKHRDIFIDLNYLCFSVSLLSHFFSRYCDGYEPCDRQTQAKKTIKCNTNQICFFREDLAVFTYNVTFNPQWLLIFPSLSGEQIAEFQKQVMAQNKQLVQVAHMETAGCVDINSTLLDNSEHADCEVDLHAELYHIKARLRMTPRHISKTKF